LSDTASGLVTFVLLLLNFSCLVLLCGVVLYMNFTKAAQTLLRMVCKKKSASILSLSKNLQTTDQDSTDDETESRVGSPGAASLQPTTPPDSDPGSRDVLQPVERNSSGAAGEQISNPIHPKQGEKKLPVPDTPKAALKAELHPQRASMRTLSAGIAFAVKKPNILKATKAARSSSSGSPA
jgi:hypothetical protein